MAAFGGHKIHRAMTASACACAMAALTAAHGFAQVVASESSELGAPQTSAQSMILGPLEAELTASGIDGAGFVVPRLRAPTYSLKYEPRLPATAPREAARPSASLFAGSLLTARSSDLVTRDGLAAFSAQPAVLAYTPSGGAFTVSVSDSANPSAARLGYDPLYAESAGRAINPGLVEGNRRMALGYEGSFNAPGGSDGLDFGVSPRAGVSIGEDGPAARAGATVRLGQYLDAFETDRPAWWLFAGADRQAVMYDPGQGFDVRDALAMQPYAMVGDAQAGVAVRVGSADVSLAYVHRETRYSMPQQGWETSEGFAAFSLTWKH